MLKSFIKSKFISNLSEDADLPEVPSEAPDDDYLVDMEDSEVSDVSSSQGSKLLLKDYSPDTKKKLTDVASQVLRGAGLKDALSNLFTLSGDSPKRIAPLLADAVIEFRFIMSRTNILPTTFKNTLKGSELTDSIELSLRRLLPMMVYAMFVYSDLLGQESADLKFSATKARIFKTVKDAIYVSTITDYTKKMFYAILPMLDTDALLAKNDKLTSIYNKLSEDTGASISSIYKLMENMQDPESVEFTGVTDLKKTALEPAEVLTFATKYASSKFLTSMVIFYAITEKEDTHLIDEQIYVRATAPGTVLQKLNKNVSDSATFANIPQSAVMGSEQAKESTQEQLINSLDGIVDDSSILKNECNPRNFILILAELIARYIKEGKLTLPVLNMIDTGQVNVSTPLIQQSLFDLLQKRSEDSMYGLMSSEVIKFLQFMFITVLDPDGKPVLQSDDFAQLLPGLLAKLDIDSAFDITSDVILAAHKVKIAQYLGSDVQIASAKNTLTTIETQQAEDNSFKARLLAYVSSITSLAGQYDTLAALSDPKQIMEFASKHLRLDSLNRLLKMSSDKDEYSKYIVHKSAQLSGDIVGNTVKILLSTNEKNRVLSQLRLSTTVLNKAAISALIKTGLADQIRELKQEIVSWVFSAEGQLANEVTFSQANKDKIMKQLDRVIAAKETPLSESRDEATLTLQRQYIYKLSDIIITDFTVIGPEIKALVYFIKDSVTPIKELANGSPVTKYEVVTKDYIKAFRLSVLPDAIVKSFVDKFEYHKELAIESINSTQLAEDVFNDLQEVLLNPFEVAREVANWKNYIGILPATLVQKLEAAEAGQLDIKELASKLAKSYVNIAKDDRPKFKEALAKFQSGSDKEWLPKLLTSYRKILADKFGSSRLGKAIEKIITKQYGAVQKLSATPYEELDF